MTVRKLDIAVGLLVVLAGLFTLGYLIPNYTDPGMGMGMSPRVFPYVCATAITVLGVFLVVSSWRRREDGCHSPIDRRALGRFALVLAALFVTLALMQWSGFIASGIVTVATLMWLMGERRWLPLVATSVGWTLFLWVFFEKILVTPLP